MRPARLLLVLCLVVGLVAVWYGALGHGRFVQETEERSLRTTLEERARLLAGELDRRLREAMTVATYDAGGTLLRPAPPAEARVFEAPSGSLALHYLRRNDPEHALEEASTSAERALVFLRTGRLADALAEPALHGTELSYRARLELAGGEPDADWVDDVSALLGGPSDRLALAMLKLAGVAPAGDLEERRHLAALEPDQGVFVDNGYLCRLDPSGSLKRLPLREIAMGAGPVAVRLPPPFSDLELRGAVDAAVLEAQTRRAHVFYGLAALILVVGTCYAYVAIGRAVRLARAKSDFVANVTHELKTPLANIRLYAESLRAGRVREADQAEFLDTLLDEAARLDTLVEGLLHAARGKRVEKGRLDVGSLVREAEARWRPRLEREGYALSVSTPPLPAVEGDREALLRAIGNLLDNARKYSTQDKRIELSAARSDSSLRIAVMDHGPGIPVSARRRVLQPFSRLESADRKETPGTGLGLSLVASCMEAHGGRVEIDGSTISLLLPLEGT